MDSVGVYTTNKIMSGDESVHFVFHDEEGDWHFMPNRQVDADEAAIITFDQILTIDKSLDEVLLLPCGSMAERQNSNEWVKKKM